MRCSAYIDPKTGIALEGDALEAALRDPNSLRCGYELYEDDAFCPSCGAKVERTSQKHVEGQYSAVPAPEQAEREEGQKSFLEVLRRRQRDVAVGGDWNAGKWDAAPIGATGRDGNSALKAIGVGAAWAVGGVGKIISGLVSAVFALIAGIWIYGAVCAHNDVEHHQSLGVVLQRMYGTEYNPLTRHGYRMYIKHFTTTSPDEKPTKEELGKRLESTVKETVEDLGAFFDDKKNSPRNRALYRLRENLADAAGNASRGRGNASDGVKSALGKFLLDELSDAGKNDDDDSKTAEQLLEIGVRYLTGNGVTKDARKAFEYSRKAAEKGNAMAQCNLGYCYENGVGVERNWIEAMKWYRKAADNGNETAKNKLKQIEGLGKP